MPELNAALSAAVAEPNVMNEVLAGDGIGLAAVGRLFPSFRGEGVTDPATVYRWATSGSRAPDGRRVVLETVVVGNRRLTSKAAVGRYIAALSGTPAAPATAPKATSPSATKNRGERAAKKLQKLGA